MKGGEALARGYIREGSGEEVASELGSRVDGMKNSKLGLTSAG